MSIDRSRLNFVLEGAALVAFAGLLATGLAMAFRLPPGSGRLALLGLSRHEWGDVHFWLAASFLGLVAAHVFLHWRWVWALAVGKDPARKRVRGIVFLAASAVLLLLAAAPWAFPVLPSAEGTNSHREDRPASSAESGRGWRGGQ